MRKGDKLPVLPEKSWENECYIDSLSAWYYTKYFSQRLIEKYQERRQILLPIRDPESEISFPEKISGNNSISTRNLPPILKNRSKRSGNEIKTVPPPFFFIFQGPNNRPQIEFWPKIGWCTVSLLLFALTIFLLKNFIVDNDCVDYNAIYNPETEQCECKGGFYDTTFGCQLFEDVECHPRFNIEKYISFII